MHAATLIVMTILGCDDSVTQCHYVSNVPGTWKTLAICDAETEKQLPKFSNAKYPVVVAVCETSNTATADTLDPHPDTPKPAVEPVPVPTAEAQPPARQPLPQRTLAWLSGAIPDTEKLKTIVTTPIHTIGDGYSWVARKLSR